MSDQPTLDPRSYLIRQTRSEHYYYLDMMSIDGKPFWFIRHGSSLYPAYLTDRGTYTDSPYWAAGYDTTDEALEAWSAWRDREDEARMDEQEYLVMAPLDPKTWDEILELERMALEEEEQ